MKNQSPKIWQIIIGGTIGNLTEWYNFLLYGYLAPTISQLFFPVQNKLISLTLTFSVFALSFFARPFGGLIFGWIGDTYGRKKALIISLFMIGIPTLLIGFLPTYQSIGMLSPILLCILRFCQGLSAGGEHTGSAVYMAEYAPTNRRALWVSTVPVSAALGIMISSLIAFLIVNSFTEQQLLTFGWRTGYWLGAFFCFVSILLRIKMPETPHFQKPHPTLSLQRYPITQLIKDPINFKNLFIVISLASTWGILYQILFIWMPTYLTHVQHINQSTALEINNLLMFSFAVLVLIIGYCADYINRKLLLKVSCIAMILFAYPLFTMLSQGSITKIYIAMGLFTFIFSLYIPSAFVLMVETFSTHIRYTGLSFGFNLGLAIFGGTCPLIVTWLIEISGLNTSPAFYMMLAALCALITSRYMIDKKNQPI